MVFPSSSKRSRSGSGGTVRARASGAVREVIESSQAWFDSVGLGGNVRYGATGESLYREMLVDPYSLNTWLDPPLPPGLAPIPPVCRLLALLMVLPVAAIALLDFAGYAVFRTLGQSHCCSLQ